ncbi:MAG: hypothetical protein FJ405_18845, partial [Verrucomicrobia bacterium]|nr:hypothetical protein [Verrucomicrobiota bacterium]
MNGNWLHTGAQDLTIGPELALSRKARSNSQPARLYGAHDGNGRIYSARVALGVAGYDSRLRTDLESEMFQKNASGFIRFAFDVDAGALERLDSVALRAQYDDGVAIWLNGEGAVRRNAPAVLTWNSTATSSHPAGNGSVWEVIELSPWMSALRSRNNVLAIQLLNQSAADTDALALAELIAQTIELGQPAFFATPTPGAANSQGVAGFVRDTSFSVQRGFFTNAFNLAISTPTPETQIYYTINGGEPRPANPDAAVYSGPFEVARSSVVRAAAHRAGWEPTDIDTQTYLFVNDIVRQPSRPAGWPISGWPQNIVDYEMDPDVVDSPLYRDLMDDALLQVPTLSLTTPLENLFGPQGIYSNPDLTGDASERPVSMEFIDPNTGAEFQTDAGLRIHGGVSRTSGVKLSLRLHFRSHYGTPKLRFPVLGPSGPFEIETLVLRGQWNDVWHHTFDDNCCGTYLRDEWARRAYADMGGVSAVGTFAHVYLNGLYWGLYNPVPHLDADFLATRLGGSKEDFDVLKNFGGTEVIAGDNRTYNRMMSLANGGLATPERYRQILQFVDPTNLCDFMIQYIYTGNEDGPGKHHHIYRRRATNEVFRFIPWDSEWALGSSFSGRRKLDVNVVDADAEDSVARLFQRMRANSDFRRLFADRADRHLLGSGALTPARAIQRWTVLMASVTNAIIGESARWGDLRTSLPNG